MSDFDDTLGPLAPQPGQPGYRMLLWRGELLRYTAKFEGWEKDAAKVEERYALEGDKARRGTKINMLWSNVETLGPALYAKPPKVVAARRYLDKDPIGRVACRIIQRALQYQIDSGELHAAVQMAVLDRLLPGRGQVWCRYEPTIEGGEDEQEGTADPASDDPNASADAMQDDDGDAPMDAAVGPVQDPGRVVAEVVHVDYVHWRDFRHDPARTWDEVQWVARRAYMTRDELVARFGAKGRAVPLNCGPDGDKTQESRAGAIEAFRKAEVWEVWHKQRREVVWLAIGLDEELDVRPDPYGLEQFYPCPKPLFATVTNSSLVPTPDYVQYEDQAEQLDTIADREDGLTEAMRVRGAYDASAPEIARILKADATDLIAVDRWEAFAAQAGGLKGSIDFLPLDVFAKGLEALAKRKAEVKADAFEVTGLSDIMRGQGDPDETATGVQTKGHFATLRLKRRQADVAVFVRDVIRIMAEMTCELFQPETLAEMASCQEMDELQIPAPPMPLGLPGMPPGASMAGLGPAVAPQATGMAPGGPPMLPARLPVMAGSPAAAAAPGIGR